VEEDFVAEDVSELSVAVGSTVIVLEAENQQNAGWILVSSGSQRGYVPSAFLSEIRSQGVAQPLPSPFDSGGNPFDSAPAGLDSFAASATNEVDFLENSFPTTTGLTYEPNPTLPPATSTELPQTKSTFWSARDSELFMVHYPTVSSRRWFYRDIFNDIQGPFNAQEMIQRINAKHIKGNTSILAETGTGAASSFYEEILSEMFPNMSTVFMEPPQVRKKRNDPLWYFVDVNRCEQGPFSSEQMKFWLDQGFFSADTTVRKADGTSPRIALYQLFSDPALAFPYDGQGEVQPSTVTSKVLKAHTSGKQILAAALDGIAFNNTTESKTNLPPPALGQDKSTTKLNGTNDETFEKVNVDGNEAGATEVSKPAKKPEFKVYGAGWGEYKGVPTKKDIPDKKQYSARLYTFVTRPLHPEAGTILCYIHRDIDGAHINFNKYVLYHEETKTPIMAAYRNWHIGKTYYDIKLNTTGKAADSGRGLTIAHLDVNFSGTEFTLHNNVSGHSGTAKDLGVVVYQRSRGPGSVKGPRKMKCGIPEIKSDRPEFLEWEHKGKSSQMAVALKSLQIEKGIIPLLNKPPTWNTKKKAYTLGFKGRVKVSSVKNFQLVDAINDPSHDHVLMQHGRVSQVRFSMDTHHPLSLLQSFAFALSSLHSKKLVD